jgi:uncharacterized protein (TIGR02300 family)
MINDLTKGMPVAKAEWGLKRVCPNCATRYYDFKKNPPVCPSCGTAFDPESLMKTRRGRSAEAKKPLPAEELEELPVLDAEEADDAVIEDADELGDDEVDVEEVVEVEDAEEESR